MHSCACFFLRSGGVPVGPGEAVSMGRTESGQRVGPECCCQDHHHNGAIKMPKGMDLEGRQVKDSGQARLEALGYKQELRRKWGTTSSFSCSFALMSCIMCITGAPLDAEEWCSPCMLQTSWCSVLTRIRPAMLHGTE